MLSESSSPSAPVAVLTLPPSSVRDLEVVDFEVPLLGLEKLVVLALCVRADSGTILSEVAPYIK